MKIVAIQCRSWMVLILSGLCVLASPVFAGDDDDERRGGAREASLCKQLPSHHELRTALQDAVAVETSGYDFDMWATIVDRDGIVCAVAFSGADRHSQLMGARVITAQKANAVNSFGLDLFVLSTANSYSLTQPGGWGYGLLQGNPVDTDVAYKGPAKHFGKPNDPMTGRRVGGAVFFGGGLGLYDDGKMVGGLGAGGDTPCADHMIAWRVRHALGLDEINPLVALFPTSGDPDRPDNIVYDIIPNPNGGTGISPSGVGHPLCLNQGDQTQLPPVQY